MNSIVGGLNILIEIRIKNNYLGDFGQTNPLIQALIPKINKIWSEMFPV